MSTGPHPLTPRSEQDDRAHQDQIKRAAAELLLTIESKPLSANAALGCGLPIGNLSSQYFANVYMDALDQFVKHKLKAPRYLRYVDDFVLVHRDRAQLEQWLTEIRQFLKDDLRLDLKADIKLKPLSTGIDFLGYVVFSTHTRVRRRVVSHARESLSRLRAGDPSLESVWRSYEGHFKHANAWRLRQGFLRRYPAVAQLEVRS